MEHLDEEFQAEVIDKDVADGDEEIPHNLGPAPQSGTRKANVSCHPETRQEGDGELEHKGRNVRGECNETEFDDLAFENEMVENIVQHPFQNEVHATASRIAEQLEAHHLTEGRVEEVDDSDQSAFYPGFYVLQG